MNTQFNFFKEAVKSYKTSGTIVPSSRFLANKMLKNIDFSTAKVIVELGPGNGAFTKQILKKINPQTTLICFEINEAFYNELLLIKHPQLKVINASAEFLDIELKKNGFKNVDYVISSIPLSILPKPLSKVILNQSYSVLNTGGTFIQFQYSLFYFQELKRIFSKKNISLAFEPRNFPPAFVYYCSK